MKCWFSFRNR